MVTTGGEKAMMDTETKIKQAIVALIQHRPFWGELALRLRLIETPAIRTCATDGTYLWFNPEYASALTPLQTLVEVMHEVAHCVYHHPQRIPRHADRDKWLWACEHPADFLIQDEQLPIPPWSVLDQQYRDWTAEEIYQQAPDCKKPLSCCSGFGEGSKDLPREQGVRPNTAQDWEIYVQQAAQSAKMRGMFPAGLEQLVKALGESEVDWMAYLYRFIQTAADRTAYSWLRPNRKYTSFGLYLPTLRGERVGRIGLATDSSGSTTRLLPSFMCAMEAIQAEVKPDELVHLYCDAQVQKVSIYGPDDPFDYNVKGFGGTAFEPVFTWLEQDPPLCLIYLTDLEGSFPAEAPPYPVLWVVPHGTTITPPFGEVLPIKVLR
jgi:predicted metal-dependent peptidase